MKLPEFLDAIKKHADWLKGLSGGIKLEFHARLEVESGTSADLRYADLSYANLSSADLSYADLRSADLRSADLRYADLSSADLSSANLSYANLSYANFRSADLLSADLRYVNLGSADLSSADLSCADLRSADLDRSNVPMCCASLKIKADIRLAAQWAYHLSATDLGDDPDVLEAQKFLQKLANRSHVIPAHGLKRLG